METKEVTHTLLIQEKELNLKILNAARKEEEELRVKSKQLWLKGRDSNTEYFHKQTKARQSYNFIKDIKDNNGNKIAGQEEIKEHAFTHFRDLYTDSEETEPKAQVDLLLGIPTLIEGAENRELSKPIMEFEIKNAIWSLQEDKAPGPDGFTINFYRAAWEIIKEDLKRMLN